MRSFLTMLLIGASLVATPALAQDAAPLTFSSRNPSCAQIARVVEVLVDGQWYDGKVVRPQIFDALTHQHEDLIAQAREIEALKAEVADLKAKLEEIISVDNK